MSRRERSPRTSGSRGQRLDTSTQALRGRLLYMTLVLATTVPSFAQTPAASPRLQQSTEQQRQPVFEATVKRVRVDVIVTDEQGRFVEDLTADDFVVLEDGEPQSVLSVQLVDLARSRIVALAGEGHAELDADTFEPPSARGAAREGVNEAAAAEELAPEEYGAVFVLLDSPGLDWRMKARFAGYWESWLDDADTLTVPWAFYVLDDDARLHELAPLTRDLAQLQQAADRLRDTDKLRAAVFASQPDGLRGGIRSPDAAAARSRLFDPLSSFAEGLAGQRRGRIALVWVTSLRGVVSTDLVQAANSANVSIYVLDPGTGVMARDPRRLGRTMSMPIADATRKALPGGGMGEAFHRWLTGQYQVQFFRRARVRDQRRRLSAAPEATGGQFFADWSALAGPLAAIEADTGRYYLLTYAPPPPDNDGRYHEIRVEVRRPGVDVRARGGYLDKDGEPDGLSDAFRYFGSADDHLPFVFDTVLTWTEEGKPRLTVISGLDGSAVDEAQVGVPAELELRGEIFDDQGRTVIRLLDYFREAGARAAAGDLLRGRYVWEAKPGLYQLHVLVRGPDDERISAVRRRIHIPDPESSPWLASHPLLLAPGPDGELEPLAGGQARAGERVLALQQVLKGQEPVLSGVLRRTTESWAPDMNRSSPYGDRPADTTVDIVTVFADLHLNLAPDRRAERPARHQGGFPLPANLEPGDYEIELQLVDEPADERRTFLLPLRILPRR